MVNREPAVNDCGPGVFTYFLVYTLLSLGLRMVPPQFSNDYSVSAVGDSDAFKNCIVIRLMAICWGKSFITFLPKDVFASCNKFNLLLIANTLCLVMRRCKFLPKQSGSVARVGLQLRIGAPLQLVRAPEPPFEGWIRIADECSAFTL
jgi:hypothetical protein